MNCTPITRIGLEAANDIYVKREDMIPFSFGGNKARKAYKFFEEFDTGNYDCVVTYGTSHSNHCRVVANMSYQRNVPCYIICPDEVSEETFNSRITSMFGAKYKTVPVNQVSTTIEKTLKDLRREKKTPLFIEGGGHGNIGTAAYVECYDEIKQYENENKIFFDYIFLATGTGTTQAGLICGKILNSDQRSIVGISIARKKERGKTIVVDSVEDYLNSKYNGISLESVEKDTVFVDDYIGSGYGTCSNNVKDTINKMIRKYGIPMDETYTGKAYYGMLDYIEKNRIKNRNVLFLHTGGTPLFFDYLDRIKSTKGGQI